jgi:branched-chain amino acid transport system ATP-binding protein
VTKRFGGLLAVNDVNIDMRQGELISLIGPNGAGKTTLFNLLTGQLAPSAGQIVFAGQDVSRVAPSHRARLGFGRTFQISQTLTSLTVLENAMVGAFLHHAGLKQAAHKALESLTMVGLHHRAKERASHLTLGERRRLEVARALALDPKLLLLDEVMAGLNQTEIREILGLIKELHGHGHTIIVIEHNLKVVRALSQRVIVLHRGAILAEGDATDVLQNPDVIEAYVGKRRA